MTLLMRTIPVLPADVPGAGSLGRHVRHDSRSRAFAYQPTSTTLRSAIHQRRIPVLDQGSLGACVAYSSAGALGTDPHFDLLADTLIHSYGDEFCRALYHDLTAADDYAGTWPPDDTGSDGLTAGQVLLARKYISSYQHTFTTNDALLALGDLPLITGINWYSSMDEPLSTGEVRVTSQAYVRGGHEVEGSEIDVENRRVWFWNSWGTGFGVGGRFWMSFDTWDRLLHEQGDVTIFMPLSVAPTPQPTPDPLAEADAALAAVLKPWSKRSVWYDTLIGNKQVKAAARAWLKARGF